MVAQTVIISSIFSLNTTDVEWHHSRAWPTGRANLLSDGAQVGPMKPPRPHVYTVQKAHRISSIRRMSAWQCALCSQHTEANVGHKIRRNTVWIHTIYDLNGTQGNIYIRSAVEDLRRTLCPLWLEVFVRPLHEFVSLWWTFGGGTKLIIDSGSRVRPSVSLLPPSSQQLSGGSATLACLLSGYSPPGAVVSWEVDGAEVTEGVLTSSEEEKSGRYSSSSTLSLSQERWMEGELYSCKVLHHDHSQTQSLHRSQCQA
ncbi:T cell receptor beta chain MC.7.G5-like [Chelmon rostratus]|uniref:T cell receptor beta chain MC.7.G5-like n=1 Tax=Chelmon rostratus TaxID=109905 RepID=UPI001BECD79E|nr:T cell receptor beta chain MC.7.G5-like [Chelmon rostratus]